MPPVAMILKPSRLQPPDRARRSSACRRRGPRRTPCRTSAPGRRRRAGSWRRRWRSRGRGPSPRRSSASPGPSRVSTPGKRANGNTASLTATWSSRSASGRNSASGSPAMTRAPILATGDADGLGDERHGARGARIDLEHVDVAVLDGELHVHQARRRSSASASASVWRSSSAMRRGVERVRRQRAGASRRNGCRPPRCAP